MCLTIYFGDKDVTEEEAKKPRKAKKDIICYKILKAESFRDFQTGKLKRTGKLLSPYRKFPMKIGYHYYQEEEKFSFCVYFKTDWRGLYTTATKFLNRLEVHQGLHAYTTKTIALNETVGSSYYIVVECIIPKGSEYFRNNEDKEIVADNLILVKRIKQ